MQSKKLDSAFMKCVCVFNISFEIIEIKAEKKIVELYMYEHIFTF